MDAFHPWTKYEVARLRDEERLLRARAAMHLAELRIAEEVESPARPSLLDRLRRRDVSAEQATVRARPV
jgi:hypothetical protein